MVGRPELFVVVDDADSDPGLDALLELLPFAADIGLHLVQGRRSGQFQRLLRTRDADYS